MSTLADRIEIAVKDILDRHRNMGTGNHEMSQMIRFAVARVYQSDALIQRYEDESQAPATLLPHQQRVVDEKRELDEKLCKLSRFIDTSPEFSKLDVIDRSLLDYQKSTMKYYSGILGDRIKRFDRASG